MPDSEKNSDRWIKAGLGAGAIHLLLALFLFSVVAPDGQKGPLAVRLRPSTRVDISVVSEPAKLPAPKSAAKSLSPVRPEPGIAVGSEPASPAQAQPPAEAGDDDDSATLIGGGSPEYPLLSRRMGEEGEVRLRLRIDRDGRVTEASVEHSSGFPRLDGAALEFFREARFQFAQPSSQPLQKKVSIRFRLRDVEN